MKKNKYLSLVSFLVFISINATSQLKSTLTIKPPVILRITVSHDTLCPGDTLMMFVNKLNGATYIWSPGGETTDTIYVNPFTTTSYTVIVNQGINNYRDSITITVIPLDHPTIKGTGSVCKGHKDTLYINGASTYLWSNGKTTSTYFTGPIFGDSMIYVTAFNQIGCTVTDSFKITMDICTGINEVQNSNQFYISPNPNNGIFSISIRQPELISEVKTIEIYNVMGEKVNFGILKQVQGDYRINMSQQPIGIYFYRIMDEGGIPIGTGKIITDR